MTVVQDNLIRKAIDFIYNPDNQSKTELIDSFVVRQRTFERLFKDIKEANMQHPAQHYIIEGKRGMGKTTMLLRLAYAIENETALNSWLIPIMFNEEEYSIRKLYKLWERIAILLEEKDDTFSGLFDEMDESFKSYKTEVDYERGIYKLLDQKLEAAGKKLVLFIDNFGDIFSKFSKQEVQQLRTVLQTTTNFRIFGASSTTLEIFYDYKHPFYEYFKISRLRGLNATETNNLLLKLGGRYGHEKIKDIIENEPGRVEALRRLTGGVIRTIVLLFEIFIDQKKGSAFNDLEALLDRVTPLYKHRMDDLPAQQQEIIEALALEWDAINAGEISQKTRIPSKTVSAQLRQMEKNEIITKKMTSIKNHYYQISERFFNIWYLMRHGKKSDKNKVVWLVRFLEEWCSEDELINRVEKHIKLLKQGDYDEKAAYLLTEALAGTKDLPNDMQDKLIDKTREFLGNKNSEWIKELSESDIKLNEQAIHFWKDEKYNLALNNFLKMKDKNNTTIAWQYIMLEDYKNAEGYITKIIKEGDIRPYTILLKSLNLLNKSANKSIAKTFYAYILILCKNIDQSQKCLLEFLDENNSSDLTKTPIQLCLIFSLANKQYQFLYDYFTNPKAEELNIKEQFKPIWYALMYYIQDKHPNEYLRMGSELEETVKEIIERVEQMRIDYA